MKAHILKRKYTLNVVNSHDDAQKTVRQKTLYDTLNLAVTHTFTSPTLSKTYTDIISYICTILIPPQSDVLQTHQKALARTSQGN